MRKGFELLPLHEAEIIQGLAHHDQGLRIDLGVSAVRGDHQQGPRRVLVSDMRTPDDNPGKVESAENPIQVAEGERIIPQGGPPFSLARARTVGLQWQGNLPRRETLHDPASGLTP